MTAYKLKMIFEGALHHGSGFGLSGVVDRAVLRDTGGVPYIAGSAIKGKLRHAALRVLLSTADEPVCHTADGDAVCEGAAVCTLCDLFGSPRRQGTLYFSDAQLSGKDEALGFALARFEHAGALYRDSRVRARTSIDRQFGTVREGLLFTTEVLPEGLEFEATIRHARKPGSGSAIELLRMACYAVTHMGADGARGLGKCQLSVKEDAQ